MGQLICTEKCVDNRPAFTAVIPIMWTVSDAGYGISLPIKRPRATRDRIKKKEREVEREKEAGKRKKRAEKK